MSIIVGQFVFSSLLFSSFRFVESRVRYAQNLHGGHFGYREIHEREADKHNQERPDHTGGSTIGHDRREGSEQYFPRCDQSTRESDHRSELEIPLARVC